MVTLRPTAGDAAEVLPVAFGHRRRRAGLEPLQKQRIHLLNRFALQVTPDELTHVLARRAVRMAGEFLLELGTQRSRERDVHSGEFLAH